jgi:hypothetical protein
MNDKEKINLLREALREIAALTDNAAVKMIAINADKESRKPLAKKAA